MTQQPATVMTGHLAWTHAGTVWATWRLSPLPYGMRPAKDKAAVRDLHRGLWRALHGEALLLGLVAVHDPADVVERMITGVDLGEHPQWAAECEATLDELDGVPLGERSLWLSVPLANSGAARFSEPLAAAWAGVQDALALPRARPSRARIQQRLAQAQAIEAGIPAVFAPRPASVAEQVWLAAHQQRRGLLDLAPPTPVDATTAALLTPRSGVALPEPVLDEGGQGDVTGTDLRRLNPLARRYLKVTDPRASTTMDQPPSYQCLMAISDMPAGGMTFPGSEYLAVLDRCGVDVDWAVRIRVSNRERVLKRTRRAVRTLNDQYEQRDGQASTGHHELDLAGDLLAEYQAAFANDTLEVEVAHTTILAVADADPAVAQDHAKTVAGALAAAEVAVDRPVGAMESLWWQMHPGVATNQLTRQFAQLTTAADYACVVPLTASTLGDRDGILLATTRSTSRPGVVLHRLDGHTGLNVSASVAVCGELGSGKTFTILSLAGAVVDRGGQLLVIDRSAEGEYARYVRSLPQSAVVDVGAPVFSVDPLRVLGPAAGAVAAQSFLTPLTGIAAQSEMGDALAEVLEPGYLLEHDLGSLAQVLAHLGAPACTLEGAQSLARRIRSFARKDLGRCVFDESLPPLPLGCPAIVWATNAVDLPSAGELTSGHLFRQLRPEKIFGRALYALIPALARQAMKLDRDRFTALVCDEAHAINSSPESSREVTLFIREGRRANAAVILGSHDADSDFGDETQRGLIRSRIVLRHTDETLARRALTFLGLDPGDDGFDAHVEDLRFHTSPLDGDGTGVRPDRCGEGYMRDVRGGIEPVRILGPARQERRAAIVTTPGHATGDEPDRA